MNTTSYSPGAFFMLLKLGLWTAGQVEGIGRISLHKTGVNDKNEAYPFTLKKEGLLPMRVGTDLFLTSLFSFSKGSAEVAETSAIAVFTHKPLGYEHKEKEIVVKLSGCTQQPFSQVLGQYKQGWKSSVTEYNGLGSWLRKLFGRK